MENVVRERSEQLDIVIAINVGLGIDERGRTEIQVRCVVVDVKPHWGVSMFVPEHISYHSWLIQDPSEWLLADLVSGRGPEILRRLKKTS